MRGGRARAESFGMTDLMPRTTAHCSNCAAELHDGVRFCDQCGRSVLGPVETAEPAERTPAASGRTISRRVLAGIAAVVAALVIGVIATAGHTTSLTGTYAARDTSERWTFMHGVLAIDGDNGSCSGQYSRIGSVVQAGCLVDGVRLTSVGVISTDGNLIGVAGPGGNECLVRTNSREAVDDTGVGDACDSLESRAQSARDAQPSNS